MRRFYFILNIGFLLGFGWVNAQTTGQSQNLVKTVDRTALFTKAFEILPVIFAAAKDMGTVSNELVGDEFRMYEGIYAHLIKDFATQPELRIKFLLQQKPFQLSPDQPIRTAVTSSEAEDPIYINKRLINNPQNDIQIEDVVQLLIHEYGHKVRNKNQNAVDSLSAKIRQFFVQYSQKVATPQGDILQLVSLPDILGADHVTTLIESKKVDQEYYKMAALFQTPTRIVDLSHDWNQFHVNTPTFQLMNRNELIRASYIKLDNLIYVDSPEKEPLFLVSTQHVESVIEKVAQYPKASDLARGNWDSKDLFIKIDRTKTKIKSIFLKKLLQPENDIKAQIQEKIYLTSERMALIVKIDNLQDHSDIRLIVDSDNTNVFIKPKFIDKNLNLFYFEFDTSPQKAYKINSLAINSESIIYFSEGFSLPARISNAEIGKRIRLKTIYFSDDKVRTKSNSGIQLMDVQVKLHFKLTSEHDLQEIKLGISRQNHIYTPPSYVLTKDDGLSINSNARPFQEHKIESLRNSYDVLTFAAGDFIQKRIGKEIYVEIRLPEKIGDVAIPGQERLVRKSFFHFPRTLKTNLVIGKSSSLRAVSHVEFVDTKLNSTNVVPKTPWTYQIKSENHESANPYVNMSEETWKRYWSTFSDINDEAESSCSSLFKN